MGDTGREFRSASRPQQPARNTAVLSTCVQNASTGSVLSMDLARRARETIAQVPKDLLARAAAFLLLKDSKSSYAIEGERPPHNRILRWGQAIKEAGRHAIDVDQLVRLQSLVIGDARFIRLGLRDAGGFIGEHDRDSRAPIPDHISARADDLKSLIEGMVAFDRGPALNLDPVIARRSASLSDLYMSIPLQTAMGEFTATLSTTSLRNAASALPESSSPSQLRYWRVSKNIAEP